MRQLTGALSALALTFAAASLASAETFVLDSSTGAAYDAVGDGWFFANPMNPSTPPDGVGDAGGNDLAVGLITGVVELRSMAEFPLAPLGSLTAAQIQSATITVTVDDILSSFGPGANFNSTSSDPIAVYHYPANGIVTTADFAPAGATQIGLVHPGPITDITLASTGAVSFTVDATAALQAALTAGDTAFGVLLGTTDSPTGTSLDDLSPPGVAGGKLPFITVETLPLQPPQLSSAAQTCQSTIAKESSKVVSTGLKSFQTCFGLILKDNAPDATLAPATASKCADALDPSDPESKLGKAIVKFGEKVNAKCGALSPSDIGSPCDPAASNFADTIGCLDGANLDAIQSLANAQYGGACTLLLAVGLDGDFPGICIP